MLMTILTTNNLLNSTFYFLFPFIGFLVSRIIQKFTSEEIEQGYSYFRYILVTTTTIIIMYILYEIHMFLSLITVFVIYFFYKYEKATLIVIPMYFLSIAFPAKTVLYMPKIPVLSVLLFFYCIILDTTVQAKNIKRSVSNQMQDGKTQKRKKASKKQSS